jgi:hypothetical protein
MEDKAMVQFNDTEFFAGVEDTGKGFAEMFAAVAGEDVKRIASDIRRISVDIKEKKEPFGDIISLAGDIYNLFKHTDTFVKAGKDIANGAKRSYKAIVD